MTHQSIYKFAYRKALTVAAATLGIRTAKILDARVRFGRRIDLNQPRTLADKVAWLGLHGDTATQSRLSDKFAVRDYVRERNLGDILVPLVGGPWVDADDIPFDALATPFILKATHGCEMNLVCTDVGELDHDKTRVAVAKWLKADYGRACLEPHYKLIPHRVYAEELLIQSGGLVDYKIHCFNGEPGFILVCSDRESELKLYLFDTEWNALPGLVQMIGTRAIPAPEKLGEMLEVARALTADFDFARVDLYEVDGRVYFGEMTFSPAAGVFPYFSEEFLLSQGRKLTIAEK